MVSFNDPHKHPWIYRLTNVKHMASIDNKKMVFEFKQTSSLLVVLHGEGQLIYPGASIRLSRGRTYIVSTCNQAAIRSESEDFQLFILEWAVEWVSSPDGPSSHNQRNAKLAMPTALQRIGELHGQPFSQVVAYVEEMDQYKDSQDPIEQFLVQVRFQELLLFLLQQNKAPSFEESMKQSVERSIAYIKLHYNDILTVDELADRYKVPRWQYSRIFKKLTGQNPLQFINMQRMIQARKLLLVTHDRLSDIADQVGFANEYYFSRKFKQDIGISPGQYRRNHRENVRVFAPFLEDFLMALGITPVMQCSHDRWGKQDYLNLYHVPAYDLCKKDVNQLSSYKPDFIVLDGGSDRWFSTQSLQKLAPTYVVRHFGENWQLTLRTVADLLGKRGTAENIIDEYRHKASLAKLSLKQKMNGQTVAFLRISAGSISLYSSSEHGYTGPILHQDLGLAPDPFVLRRTRQQRKILLSMVELPMLQADHLFITFDKGHSRYTEEERAITQTPEWRSMRAVQTSCVYEVDFFTWMNYGVLSHLQKIKDVLDALG